MECLHHGLEKYRSFPPSGKKNPQPPSLQFRTLTVGAISSSARASVRRLRLRLMFRSRRAMPDMRPSSGYFGVPSSIHDPYSGIHWQPSARLPYRPSLLEKEKPKKRSLELAIFRQPAGIHRSPTDKYVMVSPPPAQFTGKARDVYLSRPIYNSARGQQTAGKDEPPLELLQQARGPRRYSRSLVDVVKLQDGVLNLEDHNAKVASATAGRSREVPKPLLV